jgi:hypothetical protein
MDLLASIFAYLGAVAGIFIAVALSYNLLIYKPLYAPRVPQATAAVVAKSSAPEMAKPKARRGAKFRHAPLHANRSSADDASSRIAARKKLDQAKERSRHLAGERSRRRLARGPQSSPKEWADRPVPRAPYSLGYAQVPRAPFGNNGFE